MHGNNLYDPGLHLFVDNEGVQDHPGFQRKVQRPQPVQDEPVLRSDRPWEGHSIQLWGSVLYDEEEKRFKAWYYAINQDLYMRGVQGYFMCYATSKDGVEWEKPELGIVSCEGSSANNIVYPPPGVEHGIDPWGVIKDPWEEDPARRYKMGMYQQRPTAEAPNLEDPDMSRAARNQARKIFFDVNRDHHGMYAAFSPDGIHWTLGEDNYVPRAGDAGTLVYDPMRRGYLAVSRRYETLSDHFVLEWKKYRRVIALSSSQDFVHWTPLKTVLKPDDFDDSSDQMYVMTPFVYGNQYLGFIGMLHSATELGPVQLAAARDLDHWQRVGRREEFLPVGSPGSWDGAWASLSSNPPVLVDNQLYMWYTGMPQAHGTASAESAIGLVTLRKDGFVALRCGISGGELMSEPFEVTAPGLFLNAQCLFGRVQVRVIDDISVPQGYGFEACNALEQGDETDFELTWGAERRDLSAFVGRKIRLQIQAENATSLFSYRIGLKE